MGRLVSIHGVIGPGDRVMIGYYRRTGGDLRLAIQKNGGWRISTIDDQGDVGRCTSMALNPNVPGGVAIAYDDSNTGAKKFAASLNGLAFERAADPNALPDEVFAEFVTAVLGCAIAAPAT